MQPMRSVVGPTIIRYSLAFKQQVVSEVESGELSIVQAMRKYDITGCDTIQRWIKKMGKNHLLAKVVRVEKPQERDQTKVLRERIQKLESALSDAHIKNVLLESLIEVADEYYKTDLKKNFGTELSKRQKGKSKKTGK
jgi:transposase